MSNCVFGCNLVLKLVHSHSGIPRVSAGQPKTQLDIQMHNPNVIRMAPKGCPEMKAEKIEKTETLKTLKKLKKPYITFREIEGGVHLSESYVFFQFYPSRRDETNIMVYRFRYCCLHLISNHKNFIKHRNSQGLTA